MSGPVQLPLLDLPAVGHRAHRVRRPPLPDGVELLVAGTRDLPPLIIPGEDLHLWRFHGWFYGYPPCCIEDFVATAESRMEAPVGDLPMHPVSGHLLCPKYATGPLAPLRNPRPADHYTAVREGDDGQPEFYGAGCWR